jgi:hypothetical protein
MNSTNTQILFFILESIIPFIRTLHVHLPHPIHLILFIHPTPINRVPDKTISTTFINTPKVEVKYLGQTNPQSLTDGLRQQTVEVGDSSLSKNAVYVVTALWLCA